MLAAEAHLSGADGLARLAEVVVDPAGAVRRARAPAAFLGGEPLRFGPDMPASGGMEARRLNDEELDRLVDAPLEEPCSTTRPSSADSSRGPLATPGCCGRP